MTVVGQRPSELLLALLLVVLGLGELVATSEVLYEIVKLGGAAYLVFLGVQALRHRRAITVAESGSRTTAPLRPATALRQGFLVGFTNPKLYVDVRGAAPAVREARPRSGAAADVPARPDRLRAGDVLRQHLGARGQPAAALVQRFSEPRQGARHGRRGVDDRARDGRSGRGSGGRLMRTRLIGLGLAGVLAATGTAYAVSVAEARDAVQPSAQKAPVVGTTCHVFPANNYWHADIRSLPVAKRSAAWLSHMSTGLDLHPDFGPSFGDGPTTASRSPSSATATPGSACTSTASRSDRARYPLGSDTRIEGGRRSTGDRHAIMSTRACAGSTRPSRPSSAAGSGTPGRARSGR